MLKLAADENFNNDIIRGLLRRKPDLDIVRIQDVGLSGADDPTVLGWAAQEERILLTHDVKTITRYAYKRVDADQAMPGVFEVSRRFGDNWLLSIEARTFLGLPEDDLFYSLRDDGFIQLELAYYF